MKNKSFIFINFFMMVFSLLICSCKKNHDEVFVEPEVFTLYSADLFEPKSFDNAIAKEITKATGVYLEFMMNQGSEIDDINLMITNNHYPDLIFAKGELTKLIEEGAVIPLDDFIEKKGKNIKNLYKDQIVKLRNSLEDPSIYTVGTYEIKNKTTIVSGNLQLQNQVLREFGYPKIKTLEDYENIIKAYIKKYPIINGHKTIGFSFLTDSWYWYVCLSNPGNFILGLPDDGQWIINQETFKATYKFLYPDMKIYYKWLNKLFNEGLLDPESFTQDSALWISKLSDGYVLGTSAPDYLISQAQSAIIQNSMDSRTFAYLPVVADSSYKDQVLKDYGFSGGWGIAITKDCKNVDKAFEFLDWFCSEEAQILINWGVEGIDYYYDFNKIRIGINTSKNRGVGDWRYPFPQGGAGYLDFTGNPMSKVTEEEIIKNYSLAEIETLNAYGVKLWTDLFTPTEELEVSKHGQVWQYPLNSYLSNLVADVDEYVKKALTKIIVGPENSFDNEWEQMKTNIINMGINDAEKEISKLIKMKMQLWVD